MKQNKHYVLRIVLKKSNYFYIYLFELRHINRTYRIIK